MNASSSSSRKHLNGIQLSDSLIECWKDALTVARNDPGWTTCTSSIDNSKDNNTQCPTNLAEALQVLKNTTELCVKNNNNNTSSSDNSVPIPVLKSIQMVYEQLVIPKESSSRKLQKLEDALQNASLSFTDSKLSQQQQQQQQQKKSPEATQTKFQRRMDKLRLQFEETKYSKLTDNLQDHRNEDDITAKSMTFAASVGLNMIIAPLSFGCFMYFFAGGIFDYFFTGEDFETKQRAGGATDIKRVIVGVVSGVIMMIIEMLLFVIRTHEFEEHSRKKKKKKGVEPFGVYSTNTPAVYTDKNPRVRAVNAAAAATTTTRPQKETNANKKDN